MAKYRLKKWEAGGGLRVENTSTNWNIDVHSLTQLNAGNQTYQDFLPSAYLKYKLTYNQFLHLTYFKSISRPNYYELVPAVNYGVNSNEIGNPYLQHAIADNYDIRYEWFPKEEEQLFVGAFYKSIEAPIELVLNGVSSGQPTFTPTNSSTAHNYGAEIAFTKYWGQFRGNGELYLHAFGGHHAQIPLL